MSASVFERVIAIASDLFGIPATALRADSSPENIERWDSTQHLSFVLALEESFDLQLSAEDTERIRNIGDAARVVEENLAASR